ncbi:hypothetical protein RhiJN_23928 [Ceratobasidium sp. AG-Ba]|nr:hypothetical protein RhiJN_23928 [Ceratobasidium sp. AG-Ba]
MTDIINKGNQNLSRGLAALHGMFTWAQTSRGIVSQNNLGGFTHRDARFLLRHLWTYRKSTMKTFRDIFLPGWSLVVHLLWKHIVFLGGPESSSMMNQLRELIIRYSLVCTSAEDFVIYRHYLEVHSWADHPTKIGPVDREDLEQEVSCCVAKLTPPNESVGAHEPIPLDFATDLMEALFYDIQAMKSPELSLPLLKAGFTRLWLDLSRVPKDSSVKWIDIVPFIYQLLRTTSFSLYIANTPKFQRLVISFPIVPVIVESDLLDVLGRFCLMPLLLKQIPPGVEKGETVTLENNQWKDLSDVTELILVMAKLPEEFIQPPFRPYEQDWRKTYSFLRQLNGRILPDERVRRWVDVSYSMWVELGKACGFDIPKIECSYYRCAGIGILPDNGAAWMCAGCESATYCSITCQAA